METQELRFDPSAGNSPDLHVTLSNRISSFPERRSAGHRPERLWGDFRSISEVTLIMIWFWSVDSFGT